MTDHLRLPSLTRDRALATAFRLLDRGHLRIGGEAYAQSATRTGRRRCAANMSRSGTGVLVFDYTAKCGLRQTETIDDPDLLDAAGAMLRRRKRGHRRTARLPAAIGGTPFVERAVLRLLTG